MNANEKAIKYLRISYRSNHLGDPEGAIDIAIKEAKKEVFDDLEKFNNFPNDKTIDHDWKRIEIIEDEWNDLKQRHLSTFQKKSDIIAGKQNPQTNDKKE